MDDRLVHGTQTGLWQALVREGQQRAGAPLDEDLESYLVFALMRHLQDAGLAERVLALDLLAALAAAPPPEQELREVGDRCLLIAGLFPRLAQRRRVPVSYYLDVGRGAFGTLAERSQHALAALYGRLVESFADLVRVLLQLRADAEAMPPLLRYELCLARGEVQPQQARALFDEVAVLRGPGSVN